VKLFGIYGAGGCGRGIMPLAREQLKGEPEHELVFVDDAAARSSINGHKVLGFDEFVSVDAERHIVLAVADSRLRARLAGRCAAGGIEFFSVWSEDVVRMDDVEIGEGALISPFVTLTSNIRIGAHFQANLYSYVEHDCVIGDFVTFAPRVACNGNVHIGDHDGQTPLHYAAQGCSISVAELLLANGAQVDAEDVDGNTPLWNATLRTRGDGPIVQLLIGRGADPRHRNHEDRTPAELAKALGGAAEPNPARP